ncbi:hypothetical protein GCM10027053_46480 [Intrasporangium mesophilum]
MVVATNWYDPANLMQGLAGSIIGALATVFGIWLAFRFEGGRRGWDAHAAQLIRLEAAAYDAQGILRSFVDIDAIDRGEGKSRDAARRDYVMAITQVQREALALVGTTYRLRGPKGKMANAQAVLLVNATSQASTVVGEPTGPGDLQYLFDWSGKGLERLHPCFSARVLWDGYASGSAREARKRIRADYGDAILPLTRWEGWRRRLRQR